MTFISNKIRSHFPSLQGDTIYFDNPGGTQVPHEVIEAVKHYFVTSNSNAHGTFATSKRTDNVIKEARNAMADFLNAGSPDEIVFGQNMTTLTFNISRSLGRTLQPGDEVIVTHLDHDANIAPWLSLEEYGAVIRWVDINPMNCTLDMSDFKKQLSTKTKIVAVNYASNAVGSISDLRKIIKLSHSMGSLVFIDAVHYAPHGPIDVQALDCDFLVCSAYKFYGPHVGVLYGKHELLSELYAYKVRPAWNQPPDKFETGTQNHEGLAGVTAAVDFLASIGNKYVEDYASSFKSFKGRPLALKSALAAIKSFESNLCRRLVTGLKDVPGVRIYGITDPEQFNGRTPTVAFRMKGFSPHDIAEQFAQEKIYVWDGNYYALVLMERLGLEENGGAVRVGLACYNTAAEVDLFLLVLKRIQQDGEN